MSRRKRVPTIFDSWTRKELDSIAPDVEVTATWRNGSFGWFWRLIYVNPCPACLAKGERRHWHGGGDDPERPSYGHRGSHCPDGVKHPVMVRLVPGPGQPAGVD
jgi:hypothetical protein